MFCSTCGKEIPDNAKFCTFCGSKTVDIQTSESTPLPIYAPVQPTAARPAYVPDQSAPNTATGSGQFAPAPAYGIPQVQEAQNTSAQGNPPKKKTGLIIVLVVGLVVIFVAFGVGGYFAVKAWTNNADSKSASVSKDETADSSKNDTGTNGSSDNSGSTGTDDSKSSGNSDNKSNNNNGSNGNGGNVDKTVEAVVGKYVMVGTGTTGYVIEGKEFEDSLGSMGYTVDDLMMELKDDGTFTMNLFGTTYKGTFTLNGNAISMKSYGTELYTGEISGNRITFTGKFNMVLIYEKQDSNVVA
ncbi:MAG: zinc ribbon domain-containing protein [Coriobacteriales bacterium]|jgi:hypothetical protein|nr:zinc ribbon domain-containing protein [Coriobacteriales bacterium]